MDKNLLKKLGINASSDIPATEIFSAALKEGDFGLTGAGVRRVRTLGRLFRQCSMETPVDRATRIHGYNDAIDVMRDVFVGLDHEQVWVLYIGVGGRIIERFQVCIGGLDETKIDVRRIFLRAVEVGACSLILFHNHPSGNPNPSSADCKVTEQLHKGGDILSIPLLDHIIFGSTTAYTFSESNAVNIAG